LTKKETFAVVAFGSPYQLRQFPKAKIYMAAWAVEDAAQTAAGARDFWRNRDSRTLARESARIVQNRRRLANRGAEGKGKRRERKDRNF
jgi:hypothetical protein